jgi:hypothetical protein
MTIKLLVFLKSSVLDNIISFSLSVLLVVNKYGLYSPVVLLRQILVVTLGFQFGKEMSKFRVVKMLGYLEKKA